MTDPYLFDEWDDTAHTRYWDTNGRLRSLDGFVMCRILNRNVVQLSEERYSVRMELSPVARVAAAAAGSAALSVDLELGSEIYVGSAITHAGTSHYASQVGASLPTLVVGKQYRLVATVTDSFNSPLNGYDHMNAPAVGAYAGAASGTLITQPNGFDWTPDSGTTTAQGHYEGISFQFADGHYGPGAVLTGDWLTFDGPPTVVDIGISGSGISGFFGFWWRVHLELHERA